MGVVMDNGHIEIAFWLTLVFTGFYVLLWFCLFLTSHILKKSFEMLEKLR